MRILVTGGTTFVSRFTAEYFVRKGDEVFVLNRGNREQVKGVHPIIADRGNLGEALNGMYFDAVLDITAYNAGDIRCLLDAGIEFSDYVFISSSAVYPETNPQPFTEDMPCGKNSVWGDYGVNKYAAERALQECVPNAYVLRPPYFYGIYENLYREAFPFDCALADRPFYLPSDGRMKLQFFNVADLCRLIEILLDQYPTDRVFNVGNPSTVTVREWVELCYRAAGKTPEFVQVEQDVPQRDYFCFYDYEYVLDVSKQSALMPDTTPLEQGFREEFLWYRDNLDSVYNRKPYMQYIDTNLRENGRAR